MAGEPITRIGPGVFSVEHGETRELVYVARSSTDRWAFWNGNVFRAAEEPARDRSRPGGAHPSVALSLTAPMPATVIKVLVTAGARVLKGDTLIVLEAMKM